MTTIDQNSPLEPLPKIVLDTIRQQKKPKKPMPPLMQIFFHYDKPAGPQVLDTDIRAQWSIWEGVTL